MIEFSYPTRQLRATRWPPITLVAQPPNPVAEAEAGGLGQDVRGHHHRLAPELGPDGHPEARQVDQVPGFQQAGID